MCHCTDEHRHALGTRNRKFKSIPICFRRQCEVDAVVEAEVDATTAEAIGWLAHSQSASVQDRSSRLVLSNGSLLVSNISTNFRPILVDIMQTASPR